MKWIRATGRECTVRDVGPVIMKLVPKFNIPIKCVNQVMTDDDARSHVRGLIELGLYEVVKQQCE